MMTVVALLASTMMLRGHSPLNGSLLHGGSM